MEHPVECRISTKIQGGPNKSDTPFNHICTMRDKLQIPYIYTVRTTSTVCY